MGKYLSGIRVIVRQMLMDEFKVGVDQDWKGDALDIYIGDALAEISGRSPYMAVEVLTTIEGSKVLDVSGIENLREVKDLEYPVGSDPRDYRNFTEIDDETIEIVTTRTPAAGGSGTLTGTVTFATGSAAIAGSGTDFDGELEAGYLIKKSTGTRWYLIKSITDDTNLILAEPVRSDDNGADEDGDTEYCYEAVKLYCAKSHTLTESASTLKPQHEDLLVMGTAGKAAVAKARELINTVPLGGARTPADMQAWGLNQLAFFEAGLRKLEKTQVSRERPQD